MLGGNFLSLQPALQPDSRSEAFHQIAETAAFVFRSEREYQNPRRQRQVRHHLGRPRHPGPHLALEPKAEGVPRLVDLTADNDGGGGKGHKNQKQEKIQWPGSLVLRSLVLHKFVVAD